MNSGDYHGPDAADSYSGENVTVCFISPEAVRQIAEIKRRKKEIELFREKFVEPMAKAITEILEAFAGAVGQAAATVADALEQIREAFADVAEIENALKGRKAERERWKNAERRFSRVQQVKMKQFERARTNRVPEMRGNTKIRKCGRREGHKKAKMHKIREEGGRNAI